jgi:hypothetical protein
MRLEIGLYGVLLAASLGAAYWASLPTKESEDEKVSLLSLEPKQVVEVELITKDTEVKAARREGDGRFWVDWKKTEKVEPPKTATATATATGTAALTSTMTSTGTATGTATGTQTAATPPPPAPEPKVTTERFLGNEKMDELLGSFAPLKALRVIGKVEAEQLKEFGLDDQSSKLVVKAGGQTITLVLGKKSYGSRNRFVLEGDRVVLVDDQGIENLERANLRLYDRRLVPFELDDVQKAEVLAEGKSRRMGHTQRDKDGQLVWSDDEDAAPAKPAYGSFMDKVAKLRLNAYADAEKEAQLAQTTPFLEVAFEKDGKVLDKIAFKKLPGEKDKPDYYVTSSFLKTHGRLPVNRIEPIEKDIEQIVSGN